MRDVELLLLDRPLGLLVQQGRLQLDLQLSLIPRVGELPDVQLHQSGATLAEELQAVFGQLEHLDKLWCCGMLGHSVPFRDVVLVLILQRKQGKIG